MVWIPVKKDKGFHRDIVDLDFYRTSSHPRYAADSCIVTLECGHTKRYKGSQVPKKRAACPECKEAYERCKPLIRELAQLGIVEKE